MLLTRRGLLVSTACLAMRPALAQDGPQRRFSFDDVIGRASELARAPFDDQAGPEPSELATLDYDGYRKIRFRPSARIKLGGAFELDLFHRGHLFRRRVGVNVISDGEPSPVPYLASEFDFGGQNLGPFPADLGFAGIRLRCPLNRPNVQDELAVFLGASYFRFLGRGQRYGLSARGLAINAGLPGVKEEFPFWREFWIEEAGHGQQHLKLYALLDSPSVSGAYEFVFRPGEDTTADVHAVLFARADIERAGIAPLTSMYFTGGSGPRHIDLFRREVHDSDGLHIRRDEESLWRPLRNPRESRTSTFPVTTLQSFGLVQRNRRFDDYQDLEAHYEMRPSYIVEPASDWGAGSIELSELATESEVNDNIVASFRPEKPLAAGERSQWRYRIVASGGDAPELALGRVHRTLISDRAAIHYGQPKGARMYLVDFTDGDLAFYRNALDELELSVKSTGGKATAAGLTWNPHAGAVRARIFAELEVGQSADFSAALLRRGKPMSETWLMHWLRDPRREQELASGMGVR